MGYFSIWKKTRIFPMGWHHDVLFLFLLFFFSSARSIYIQSRDCAMVSQRSTRVLTWTIPP